MKVQVCLVAFCSLIFHFSAYGQTPKKDDRSAEWEYTQLSNPSDGLLNHYAKDGWEIGAAAGGQGDNGRFYYVILKRSKSHPLFGTKTAEMPKSAPPPPPKPTCKLTPAQAPVIRGLRLGMTSDELFAIFPANEREEFDRAQKLKSAELPPHYGYTNFGFSLSRYATKDRFTGISDLTFELFDKKVVSIVAYYSNTPQFDRTGQLMEIITRQFGLPEYRDRPGQNEYWNGTSLTCEEFTFQVNGLSSAFSISLTDPTYKKIVEERKQVDRAKKREGFKL